MDAKFIIRTKKELRRNLLKNNPELIKVIADVDYPVEGQLRIITDTFRELSEIMNSEKFDSNSLTSLHSQTAAIEWEKSFIR